MKYLPALFIVLSVCGCATPTTKKVVVDQSQVAAETIKQREIAFENEFKYRERLFRLSYQILAAGSPFCGDEVSAHYGMLLLNKYTFGNNYQDAATKLLGLGDEVIVMGVTRGLSAEAEGIMPGDVVVSVDGIPAPRGKNALTELRSIIKNKADAYSPIQIMVARNKELKPFNISPSKFCNYEVELNDSDALNASADGKRILITKGMMRFTETDNELGLVIAHELAHNANKHINAKLQNYILGSIFDIIAAAYRVNTQGAFGKAGAQAYSKEFEAEADYVGLYIMSLSGLEIDNAANFWRRMAAEKPSMINNSYSDTHPSSPERFIAIENIVQEIKDKKLRGLALVPDMKNSTNVENVATNIDKAQPGPTSGPATSVASKQAKQETNSSTVSLLDQKRGSRPQTNISGSYYLYSAERQLKKYRCSDYKSVRMDEKYEDFRETFYFNCWNDGKELKVNCVLNECGFDSFVKAPTE